MPLRDGLLVDFGRQVWLLSVVFVRSLFGWLESGYLKLGWLFSLDHLANCSGRLTSL